MATCHCLYSIAHCDCSSVALSLCLGSSSFRHSWGAGPLSREDSYKVEIHQNDMINQRGESRNLHCCAAAKIAKERMDGETVIRGIFSALMGRTAKYSIFETAV